MSPRDRNERPGRAGATRRQFLLGGAVAGVGAAAAIAIDAGLNAADNTAVRTSVSEPLNGDVTVPFYGAHQAGIDTAAQAHGLFLAFDLLPTTDRDALRRMMRILTDDAARMTQGKSALADSEPELAVTPSRLTVTFGFGPGLVERAGGARPGWLAPLPAFSIDRLQKEYSDGDLLIQIAADDPLTVAHTSRMMLKDTRSFATLRWSQQGFRRAHGSVKPGTTMRNLFGQVDGTSNPEPGTADFDTVVWNTTDGWAADGTGIVVRRIAMDLDKWDRLDRPGRDQSVGRYQSNGAPLTGTDEFDEPDFTAKTPIGFPVIPEFSHLRRSRSENTAERIFRRAFNYDDTPTPGQISNAGLIFVSFQADIEKQFTPIQRRLDELDLLNEWTAPIGSAVFAAPPGCAEGGYIGETLLT
ncbi:dye decolorizing peroxidase [Microbacterium marinum]|uniref:Dye decolorizing peroxidase n=1 Tax=Microbacterium marinum TaxID=421115 RepID=A0A7W7BPR5_9MICO|nr:Dyp-type peroxidase [Microbacterium marinum]MBB4666584.1 dye decolorizing peroxidase [Microbacterium marinum]